MGAVASFADRRRAEGVATTLTAPIVLRPVVVPSRARVAPVLSAADERDLVRRCLAGDRMAAERILRAHHGAIQSKAKRLARRCSLLEENDLIQVGRMGLLGALRTFDPDEEGSLWAYAEIAVFRAMQAAIDEEDSTIYVPPAQQRAIRRALKTGGLSAKLEAINQLRQVASLDEPVGSDDDRTLLDMIGRRGTPEDAVLALEEMQNRPRLVAWRPERKDMEPDRLSGQKERIRLASRGRVAA